MEKCPSAFALKKETFLVDLFPPGRTSKANIKADVSNTSVYKQKGISLTIKNSFEGYNVYIISLFLLYTTEIQHLYCINRYLFNIKLSIRKKRVSSAFRLA